MLGRVSFCDRFTDDLYAQNAWKKKGLFSGSADFSTVWPGDKNNPSGTSVPVAVTVSPVAVTLSASCWNSSFAYGGNYQCTVNLSSNAGAPLGSITYTYDGGSAVSVPLSNGNAQFTLTTPNVSARILSFWPMRNRRTATRNNIPD